MKSCDILIIGAGLVGLATAYRILQNSPSTKVVVESVVPIGLKNLVTLLKNTNQLSK